MLLCNYETNYFLESIKSFEGQRYNILPPDSKDKVKPLIGRNISKDDVAGFFRTLMLTENHILILKLVNKYQIVEFSVIKSLMDYKFKECKKYIKECILTGLIYENKLTLDDKEYYWYLVDTGGVYALEDLNIEYKSLPFTTDIEHKYKHYLKSQFLIDNKELYTFKNFDCVIDNKGNKYRLEHMEDVLWQKTDEYKNTIFIVNLAILDKLNINELIFKDLALKLNKNNNYFYDMAEKSFLTLKC